MRHRGRAGAVAAVLALALVLGGCASTVADLPVMGTPAGVPERPAQPGEYLPVHDLPTSRQSDTLSTSDQAKMEKELAAARDRQAIVTPPAKSGAKAQPKQRVE